MTDKVTPQARAQEAGETARLLSYILILLASAGLFVTAMAIPASRFESLGAGAFPKMVFGALMLMSVVAIIDALRKLPSAAYGRFVCEAVAWARRRHLIFVVLAALGAYIVVLPMLGFSIASFVFIFGLELALMPRGWKTLLIATIVATVFSFGLNWLFAEVFNVFLPRGGN
ncbi:tripartite tricarboxylate transporter TctB family protein [Roseovarius sp. A-2]|uniref:tripartite tricarboxylate transporter TctB family protein n=1 Tax=Roseovarius sp. A-2 TaxID=1570360 RepID=UPI0009B53C11|nr:tripartite tricarboxylate transporter TctB family protein [Roseovarius sp. A-2]GAW36966.1 tripartite tricarboxylate transporter TctB family protein [Roseovarius sp. A-2]